VPFELDRITFRIPRGSQSGPRVPARTSSSACTTRRRRPLFPTLRVQVKVSTVHNVPVFVQSNRLSGTSFGEVPERGAFVCTIPRLPLPEGSYRISYRVRAGTGRRRCSMNVTSH
jgi:hypothetical protein